MKPTRKLIITLALAATLTTMFGLTLNAYAPSPQPACAMKTLLNGYFYLPNLNVTQIKIEMLFTTPRLIGDQSGGASPYAAIPDWPDGKVDLKDILVVARAFGSTPGAPNWNYMADLDPDLNVTTGQPSINMQDLAILARDFGNTGSYITNPTLSTMLPFLKIEFNNTLPYYSPNAAGYLKIPPSYQYPNTGNFTISYLGSSIGALVTFWSS